MRGVAIVVVDAARAFGSILLSRELADVAHRLGVAQEHRDLGGQGLHRRLADHPVAARSPGERLGRQQNQGGGGDQRSFHGARFRRS